MKPFILLMAALLSTKSFANTQSLRADELQKDLIESKFAAMKEEDLSGKVLLKSVDEKQARAIQLINAIGSYANDRFANENEKADAEYAYNGFIARFQGIREDRESLQRKEILADNKTLENYSQRLDRLMSDMMKFLK